MARLKKIHFVIDRTEYSKMDKYLSIHRKALEETSKYTDRELMLMLKNLTMAVKIRKYHRMDLVGIYIRDVVSAYFRKHPAPFMNDGIIWFSFRPQSEDEPLDQSVLKRSFKSSPIIKFGFNHGDMPTFEYGEDDIPIGYHEYDAGYEISLTDGLLIVTPPPHRVTSTPTRYNRWEKCMAASVYYVFGRYASGCRIVKGPNVKQRKDIYEDFLKVVTGYFFGKDRHAQQLHLEILKAYADCQTFPILRAYTCTVAFLACVWRRRVFQQLILPTKTPQVGIRGIVIPPDISRLIAKLIWATRYNNPDWNHCVKEPAAARWVVDYANQNLPYEGPIRLRNDSYFRHAGEVCWLADLGEKDWWREGIPPENGSADE